MPSDNTKLIVRNTAMLYIRMLFVIAVSLYTSRVVLNVLGVEDYGIYIVVAGVVSMFAFLNNAMGTGVQRFLSYHLGKNDHKCLAEIFNISITIHALICLFVFVFAETIGLWLLNTKLTIPAERMVAARWVYHLTIVSLMMTVICVPYYALIIAHERMNIYAYISIFDVSLKLVIVFLLQLFGFEKLILYSALLLIVTIIVQLTYVLYCKIHFTESRFRFIWNKDLFKILVTFSGWNLWGTVAGIAYNQGINILLNIFFGPLVNAARGIAYQVDSAVIGFVSNFQTALRPQIIKSFATNNRNYMHDLVFKGSKYSFFLLFFLCLPILMETEFILKLWLNIVPQYTEIFCKLVLINALIDSLSGPLMTSAQASGNIRVYQSLVGGLLILNLPISYLFLKMNYEPQVTLIISIIISVIALFSRLIILRGLVSLSFEKFLSEVLLRVVVVGIVALVLPLTFKNYLNIGYMQSFATIILSFISVLLSAFFLGLNTQEKVFIFSKVRSFIKQKKG